MKLSLRLWHLAPLAGSLVLAACEHKDLCFDHYDHASRSQTRIEASYNRIWEMGKDGTVPWHDRWPESFGIGYDALIPGMPEGLCVNAYSDGGAAEVSHIPAAGGVADMFAGANSLLFYNDDTEYIIFDDLSVSVSAKATTRARSRASYVGNPFYHSPNSGYKERTVTPPDPLFGHYMPYYYQQLMPVPPVLDVTLQPLVFTYLVRYEFEHGAEYVGIARGALAGMAESVFLHDGHTGPERATILYDCTVEPWGMQAVVNSFGIPDYPNSVYPRAKASYALNLEVKLKNGKTLNFNFDVSDQVESQPHGGVITVGGISISDEEGSQSGSGFDVSVEDWGEYDDIIIKL